MSNRAEGDGTARAEPGANGEGDEVYRADFALDQRRGWGRSVSGDLRIGQTHFWQRRRCQVPPGEHLEIQYQAINLPLTKKKKVKQSLITHM